jgi:type II restriction/modification system DNA methylase subunit YeeA
VTPEEFRDKWRNTALTERQACQSHFIDICRLLDVPAPYEIDTEGANYCFEKGAEKTTGKAGWADVWKRGCFGWEYKKSHADLTAAYAQLQQYAPALENPPLLIVCDTQRFIIHTNFTNTPRVTHEFGLADLVAPEKRRLLRLAFTDPDQLKPGVTRETITKEAAKQFATLADRLRARGHDPQRVAHFVSRLLFCLFAEDIGLLTGNLFTKLLAAAKARPQEFEAMARDLFRAMKDGGRLSFDTVAHFNGGLFDSDDALPLDKDDIRLVEKAAELDWGAIDPSIFGTLFERGLDPEKRAQLGKFYTDPATIMKIVEPVVLRPLRHEWEDTKAKIADTMAKVASAKAPAARTRLRNDARALFAKFHERLIGVRVLDPACGSGNFLYLALKGLKDLEHQVLLDVDEMGVGRALPRVGPDAVRGIEINPYAAELARVSIWIGEIQWMLDHGYGVTRSPILRPLDQIECRDALMTDDGAEAMWPEAEFIVGNPPFLGSKLILTTLDPRYVERLRRLFDGRLPRSVDLVCYWVERASELAISGELSGFGLVATKSIAKGASRVPLERLSSTAQGLIFEAWTNERWVLNGAKVRVAIVCAVSPNRLPAIKDFRLNGSRVVHINPDLTSGIDVTKAKELAENSQTAFQGVKLTGPFDIAGDEARSFLSLPRNPNGRSNHEVVRRLYDVDDIVGRDSDRWVVDFGTSRSEAEASFYEAPFQTVVVGRVVPFRSDPTKCRSTERRLRGRYWEFQRPRPELRKALRGFATRFIITPESSEHRLFTFAPTQVLIQGSLFAIARDDLVSLGILTSRIHEVWSTAQGNRLGVGNQRRYNIGVAFKTFPFPLGLTLNVPASDSAQDPCAQRITAAAAELVRLRDNWLNPQEWVKRVPEVVPGYPDRLLPVDDKAAAELKKRTLTNLYNQRPTWLANAHKALDEAVAAAYGWPADLSDDEILARLFALNQERAAAEAKG